MTATRRRTTAAREVSDRHVPEPMLQRQVTEQAPLELVDVEPPACGGNGVHSWIEPALRLTTSARRACWTCPGCGLRWRLGP